MTISIFTHRESSNDTFSLPDRTAHGLRPVVPVEEDSPRLGSRSASEWLVSQARKRPRLTLQEETKLAERRIEADKAIVIARRALAHFGGSPENRISQRLQGTISRYMEIRDDVISTFMERNILLAIKVSHDYGFLPTPLDSRISSALDGVREAAARFDPERGAKFSSYAAMWIQQRIYRDCRVEGREIRLPDGMRKQLVSLQRVESELKVSLGREPTDAELAQRMGIAPKRVRSLQLARQTTTTSIDSPVHEGEEATVADLIPDTKASAPGTMIASPDQLEILNRILPTLSEREQRIIRARFGFENDGVPETLEAIGAREGVTRERIRQIEAEAMGKLRRRYAQADCPPIFGLS